MILSIEHSYLGAVFAGEDEGLAVKRYAAEPEDPAASTTLTDLTGSVYLLISGPASAQLSAYVFAGPERAVGESGWTAVLAADGALVSVPLVCRTGDTETVVLDISPRAEHLIAWLGYVDGELGANGSFAIEDASELLVPLLLRGPAAADVLGDYLAEGAALPGRGACASIALDDIPVVAIGIADDAWALLVPPPRAQVLWRSFLSFTQVEPVGLAAAAHVLAAQLPWSSLLEDEGRILADLGDLAAWGLVRPHGSFIGKS